MRIVLGALFVLACVAVVCVAVAALRHRTPAQGWWRQPSGSYAAYGVLGTAVAVILAFLILVSFQTFSSGRSGASVEAVSVTELYRSSSLFAAPVRDDVRGELLCYGRAVVHQEWPSMADGQGSAVVEDWIARIEARVDQAPDVRNSDAVRLGHWLDELSERRDGRCSRLAVASPAVPVPLWIVLVTGVVLLLAYTVSFADPRERRWTQFLMAGTLTAVMVSSLLIVAFLDNPYARGGGSVRPTEMQRSVGFMEADAPGIVPCDGRGVPGGR